MSLGGRSSESIYNYNRIRAILSVCFTKKKNLSHFRDDNHHFASTRLLPPYSPAVLLVVADWHFISYRILIFVLFLPYSVLLGYTSITITFLYDG